MGVKSIIDIEISDEKFKRFKSLYDQYQAQLAKTPGMWRQAGKEADALTSNFEKMAAALLAQGEINRQNDDEEEKRLKRLTTSEKLWTSMSHAAGSMAKSVLDVSSGILKWGSIIGGALLGGSIFGIDKLAGSISSGRRSAMGLGVSVGQQASFNLNFNRLLDPDFLGKVSEMRTDPSKAGPLYTMGVGTSGSTETTAISLVKAMYEKAHATPEGMLGQLDTQTGMNVGFEQWHRLWEMKRPELNSLMAHYATDKKTLDPNNPESWQNLMDQFDRSLGKIKNAIGNALGTPKMTGALGKLSDATVNALTRFLQSPGVAKGLDQFSDWLNSLTVDLSSAWMKSKIDGFGESLGDLADFIHTFTHPIDTAATGAGGWMSSIKEWLQPSAAGIGANEKSYLAYLGRKDMVYGFPEGLLERLHVQESGGNLYPKNSPKGAVGAFGFMPDTAKQYGINPYDPIASANAGPRYLYDLEKKYAGDLAKALAAYNWGEGNLDKDIRAHGNDWFKNAPKETRDYVNKVGGLNIVVTNQTGGSAQVSVNALAAGS